MTTNAMTYLVNGAKSLIWGNPEEVQYTPKSAGEVFQEALLEFSAQPSSHEECIERCIQGVKNTRQPADCDLSVTSRELIEFHQENFNQAVDKTSAYLAIDEVTDLKAAFRLALCKDVEEKWAGIMAHSFYPILSISSGEEKVIAVQKWTDQYFSGLGYLVKWERSHSFITGDFVAKLQHQTSNAFHAHIHERIQNRMKVMHAIAEKDPLAFQSKMEEVMAKKEENSASLSIAETEYVEFLENVASSLTMHFPDVDKKMELLKKCIWNGYTLQEMKLSILEPGVSRRMFADLFKKI